MLQIEDALEIIYEALEGLNEELGPESKVALDPSTVLFGTKSMVDSLSLVSLIVDIESALSLRLGHDVFLTDDRAMDRDVLPFTSVQTLAEYMAELGQEPQ